LVALNLNKKFHRIAVQLRIPICWKLPSLFVEVRLQARRYYYAPKITFKTDQWVLQI